MFAWGQKGDARGGRVDLRFGAKRLKSGSTPSGPRASPRTRKIRKIRISPLDNSVNQNYSVVTLSPHEGRFAIVTERWAWEAMDAGALTAKTLIRVRRSRVVLAPRPWRYLRDFLPAQRGQERPLPGESTYKP
jgi:hypothetical protein